MRKAVCPGSFDPITNGHVDIIKRAAELFDEVTVLVVTNPDKKCVFSPEERCELIAKATEEIGGIKVDCFSGLLADYVKQNGINAIVKGIRSSSDFEYEFQMALANRSLAPNAETVFITADPQNMYVSSSLIRQIAAFGGDVSDFVPKNIVEEIEKRLK
ncbi:MAG: pantetheine-phosphate adenylyltransferase [Oscillospiraceae bacterium]|nr:pantetheine-phosphate adenylyltransferase [Oscillospiraceae bacterium]